MPGTRLAPGAAEGGDAHGLDFALLSRSRGGRGPAASAGDTAAGCQQTEPRSHGRPGRLPSVAPVQTFNTKRVRPETQTGRSAWVPSYRRVPPNGTQGTAWPACQPWARPRCGAGGRQSLFSTNPRGDSDGQLQSQEPVVSEPPGSPASHLIPEKIPKFTAPTGHGVPRLLPGGLSGWSCPDPGSQAKLASVAGTVPGRTSQVPGGRHPCPATGARRGRGRAGRRRARSQGYSFCSSP